MLRYVFLCFVLCGWVRAKEKEENLDQFPRISVGAWLYPGAKDVDILEPVGPNDFREVLKERLGDFARCTWYEDFPLERFPPIDLFYRILFSVNHLYKECAPSDSCDAESNTQTRFSKEKILFPGLPVWLPSFFVSFYRSVQKEAYRNGQLWQEALLDKDPCKVQDLQLTDLKELDWLLHREFRQSWADCFVEMYEDLIKIIGDDGYVCLFNDYPNPSGRKCDPKGYHPYDSRELWGDTILPYNCVGHDREQNIHIGLLRLRDLICLLTYEMSRGDFYNDFDSNGSTRLLFNKLVSRSVYLTQRRIDKSS